MDKDKIARLYELRGFAEVDTTTFNHTKFQELCKGNDSQQFSHDFEQVNKVVVEFKEKYPEIYTNMV